MIKNNRKSSILVEFAASLMLLPLSDEKKKLRAE